MVANSEQKVQDLVKKHTEATRKAAIYQSQMSKMKADQLKEKSDKWNSTIEAQNKKY